jgi:hypothetical protein
MLERMAEAGHPADGPARIIYLWPLAVVLRAPSPEGACFLKCSAGVFEHEASITAALAAEAPSWVPDVLVFDPDENWLLMRDLGADVLGAEPPVAWPAGLARLAELQRAWIGATDGLARAGAPRRSLDRLEHDLAGFLDHGGLGGRLAPDTRSAWTKALPWLHAACHRLADLAVPETLVHGDMHPWNIARTPRGLVVFDWSDGAVGHPFVDLATYVVRTDDVAARRSIADAYLDAWPEIARKDRPAVVDDAMVVGSLYQVQSYLAIMDSLDPHEALDLEGADAAWLKRALDAVDQGIAVTRRF